VCREYSEPIDLFDRHLYEKGSLVLHLLRRELGDEVFWAGVGRYAGSHGAGSVTTHDLQRALEQVSGRSLDRLFDERVRRAGHPELKVKVSWEDKQLLVQWSQTQTGPAYELCLEFELSKKGGKVERHRTESSERHVSVSLPMAERPDYVAIDPDLRIVGDLVVEAPAEMLRQQLQQGSSQRVRRTAARLLSNKHDFKSASVLAHTLHDEKAPWPVRAACAGTLGKLHHPAALSALSTAASAQSAETRAAVAEALGQWRGEAAAAVLIELLSDRSYLVSATATLALGKTGSDKAKAALQKQLEEKSWGDVVASAAVDGMAELKDPKLAAVVKLKTEYGTPTRARRSAVLALARLARNADTRSHLEQLLQDPHPHFRMGVVAGLEEVGDTKSRGILATQLERETDGRVVRRIREAMTKLDRGRPNREVLDKIAKLERNLTDLQGRLATLEAKKKGK
jgi:aminopeptidase N